MTPDYFTVQTSCAFRCHGCQRTGHANRVILFEQQHQFRPVDLEKLSPPEGWEGDHCPQCVEKARLQVRDK